MEFKLLNSEQLLDKIQQDSFVKTIVIFKHSTRCSISAMAKRILLSEMNSLHEDKIDVYYLDLLNYRIISNEVTNRFNITHESPQIVVLKNGEVVYHASHGEISLRNISY